MRRSRFSTLLPFGLITAVCLVAIGAKAVMTADLAFFSDEKASQGILVGANKDNIVICIGSGTFPITDSTLQNDSTTQFWIYQYTGKEPPFNGKYFLSDGQKAAGTAIPPGGSPLTIMEKGFIYYIHTDRDLHFRCGDGLSENPFPGEDDSSSSAASSETSSASAGQQCTTDSDCLKIDCAQGAVCRHTCINGTCQVGASESSSASEQSSASVIICQTNNDCPFECRSDTGGDACIARYVCGDQGICVDTQQTTSAQSSGHTAAPSLAITGLTPSSGPTGTRVIVAGTGFAPTGNIVHFANSEFDHLDSPDGTHLLFTVPAQNDTPCMHQQPPCETNILPYFPGQYDVSVQAGNDTSNMLTFTITAAASSSSEVSTASASSTAFGQKCTSDVDCPTPLCAQPTNGPSFCGQKLACINGTCQASNQNTSQSSAQASVQNSSAASVASSLSSAHISSAQSSLPEIAACTNNLSTYVSTPEQIAMGDVNGDGKDDIVATYWNDQKNRSEVSILLNQGSDQFALYKTYDIHDQSQSIAIGDFNGDGKNDIVIGGQKDSTGTTNVLMTLLNNGDGSFGSETDMPLDGWAQFIEAADFNGDGKDDIAIRSWPYNSYIKFEIYNSNGDGTFSLGKVLEDDSKATFFATGDYNGDGKPDLAYVHSDPNGPYGQINASVHVLLNQGSESFVDKKIDALSTGSHSIDAAADINGDGKADLIADGSVYINDGDGKSFTRIGFLPRYQMSSELAAGQTNMVAAVGDIDDDGHKDVLLLSSGLNQQSAWISGLDALIGDGSQSFALTNHCALQITWPVAASDGAQLSSEGSSENATVAKGHLTMQLTKAAYPNLYEIDDTFTVSNTGAGTASNVVLDSNGPAPTADPVTHYAFKNAYLMSNGGFLKNLSCTMQGSDVSCDGIGDLAPGQSMTVVWQYWFPDDNFHLTYGGTAALCPSTNQDIQADAVNIDNAGQATLSRSILCPQSQTSSVAASVASSSADTQTQSSASSIFIGNDPSKCTPIDCAQPPQNCRYVNPQADANGCPISCGTLSCSTSSFASSAPSVSRTFQVTNAAPATGQLNLGGAALGKWTVTASQHTELKTLVFNVDTQNVGLNTTGGVQVQYPLHTCVVQTTMTYYNVFNQHSSAGTSVGPLIANKIPTFQPNIGYHVVASCKPDAGSLDASTTVTLFASGMAAEGVNDALGTQANFDTQSTIWLDGSGNPHTGLGQSTVNIPSSLLSSYNYMGFRMDTTHQTIASNADGSVLGRFFDVLASLFNLQNLTAMLLW